MRALEECCVRADSGEIGRDGSRSVQIGGGERHCGAGHGAAPAGSHFTSLVFAVRYDALAGQISELAVDVCVVIGDDRLHSQVPARGECAWKGETALREVERG